MASVIRHKFVDCERRCGIMPALSKEAGRVYVGATAGYRKLERAVAEFQVHRMHLRAQQKTDKRVQITVNGESRGFGQPLTVLQLLESLEVEPRRVAVERNKSILRRAEFGNTQLVDGDALEIVSLVGGG